MVSRPMNLDEVRAYVAFLRNNRSLLNHQEVAQLNTITSLLDLYENTIVSFRGVIDTLCEIVEKVNNTLAVRAKQSRIINVLKKTNEEINF